MQHADMLLILDLTSYSFGLTEVDSFYRSPGAKLEQPQLLQGKRFCWLIAVESWDLV